MGKWINVEIDEELHRDLRMLAARSGVTTKAVIVMALENFVRKQEEKERQGPQRRGATQRRLACWAVAWAVL